MPRTANTWRGMALWAERKADEAAASDAPWAMGNGQSAHVPEFRVEVVERALQSGARRGIKIVKTLLFMLAGGALGWLVWRISPASLRGKNYSKPPDTT